MLLKEGPGMWTTTSLSFTNHALYVRLKKGRSLTGGYPGDYPYNEIRPGAPLRAGNPSTLHFRD